MKLATKKNGTRDGLLMVVSKDLTRCVPATEIFHPMNLAPTMQVALDNWDTLAPQTGRAIRCTEQWHGCRV